MSLDLDETIPFLNGLFIVADAVDGAYLVVDGPFCVVAKAELQYRHNLRSRLLPATGYPRVVHTGRSVTSLEVDVLTLDRVAPIEALFREVCSQPDAQVVFCSSFDFHHLVAFPLEAAARRGAAGTAALVCAVPSRSLEGNWLDGYALACETLARELPLRAGRAEPDTVAVAGYLFDRDEPDHAGNLRELERLLGALGLRTAATWLSGGGLPALREAERACAVVSLPYARGAARVLGERLGVPVLEAELPLGLSLTEEFLRRVGAHFGREEQAARVAEEEADRALRDAGRHVQRFLTGRRALLRFGDPLLAKAFSRFGADIGLEAGADAAVPYDLVVGSEPPGPGRFLCLGYPGLFFHAATERPFLGYSGFRCLVERLSNAVLAELPPGGAS